MQCFNDFVIYLKNSVFSGCNKKTPSGLKLNKGNTRETERERQRKRDRERERKKSKNTLKYL